MWSSEVRVAITAATIHFYAWRLKFHSLIFYHFILFILRPFCIVLLCHTHDRAMHAWFNNWKVKKRISAATNVLIFLMPQFKKVQLLLCDHAWNGKRKRLTLKYVDFMAKQWKQLCTFTSFILLNSSQKLTHAYTHFNAVAYNRCSSNVFNVLGSYIAIR